MKASAPTEKRDEITAARSVGKCNRRRHRYGEEAIDMICWLPQELDQIEDERYDPRYNLISNYDYDWW